MPGHRLPHALRQVLSVLGLSSTGLPGCLKPQVPALPEAEQCGDWEEEPWSIPGCSPTNSKAILILL